MNNPASRERPPLLEGPYDLAVIGGGINGTAIARDAALRGKSVVLFEKDDFGEGTSSRSSKMIHGGIRYLEQLRFGLVHESIRERRLLVKLAPHLVRPQAFILPVYQGSRRGPRAIRLGLFLYDILSLGRRLGKASFLEPREVLVRAPQLLQDGLLGGGVYHDAVMDDARLVLLNALAALEENRDRPAEVVLRNHTLVTAVRPGSPCELEVLERTGGRPARVLAHRVVRAVGPWTDPRLLVPSKGVHIVLPPLPIAEGLLLTHSKDGRVFFVIPWLGRTVVGTTETIFSGSPDGIAADRDDVAYLLDEVKRVLPGLRIGRSDILSVFAGVRPLARRRWITRGSSGSVSRSHRIVDEGGGVSSVFGGKYTTYRAVAKDVVDRAFPGTRCRTAEAPLPGGEEGPWRELEKSATPLLARYGREEVERLFWRYGSRLRDVLGLLEESPELGQRLAPDHPETRAEVVHAVTRELVVYPADFLVRRTSLRYTKDGGRSAYDAVEEVIRGHAPYLPPDLESARERYFADLEREERLRG